jgi:hypothetical protein
VKLFQRKRNIERDREDIRVILRLCSDAKLIEVLNVCESGNMIYTNTCNCLVGRMSSTPDCEPGHTGRGPAAHWVTAIKNPVFDRADHAYRRLGYPVGSKIPSRYETAANRLTQHRRDAELLKLLREEMAKREVGRESEAAVERSVECLK